MISRIEHIRNFGIFDNYTPSSNLNSFARYNLIYGWNGSGKSTLSKILYSISNKKLSNGFENSQFQISIDNTLFDSANLETNDITIQVFNDQFIKDNIDWDSIVKSLLYVSKGKVEDKKQLDLIIAQLNTKKEEIEILKGQNDDINNSIEKFLSDTAKEIKQQFEVLKTKDNYYINYSKARLRPLIRDFKELKYKRSIISNKKRDECKIIAKQNILESINIELPDQINNPSLISLIAKINDLLQSNITSKSINALKNNPELGTWVEKGISLHSGRKKCKFCGNKLSEERLTKLNEHFSDIYKNIQHSAYSLIDELNMYRVDMDRLRFDIEIYPFLKEKYNHTLNQNKNTANSINKMIDNAEKILKKKLHNPFNILLKVQNLSKSKINQYNTSLNAIRDIFNLHNNMTLNFDKKTTDAKNKLELDLAQKELKHFNYFNKVLEISKNENEILRIENNIPKFNNEIEKLEASLKDEILGAKEFNSKLHRFLNHSDINLVFDKVHKGYKIIRNKGGKKEFAKNLSEGEKTAISFIFFMTKLEEDKEKLQNSIVVLDDPISSLDSNHLFNAYSYIRNTCNNVEQLFVLTHNFSFFRLIRDWVTSKNKKRKDKQGKPYIEINHQIYNLTTFYEHEVRKSNLVNADATLLLYSSEYHYLFSRLYIFHKNKKLKLDECFQISNISRKVLEMFLNFKFPKKRSDLMALMNIALPKEQDKIRKEKVYRFINKYSHGDRIESFDSSLDNLLSESDNIVKDVLAIIKKLDKNHYNELIEVISN